MARELRCCNDTYTRGADGVWRYPWGDPVPGAGDLTMADIFAIHLGPTDAVPMRTLSPEEKAWIRGESSDLEGVAVRDSDPHRNPSVGDLIVGMQAPELHVLTMLTVADIGDLAGVSKATIDSYRYRGYLPAPQATRGRTPLWARPIVRHWLDNRPGCGWRSDLYGSTLEHAGSSR
jgi:isopentenyl diphosphate isomerase/L-lactate dehydrogenase-like FMN-dependent dehydrogenase